MAKKRQNATNRAVVRFLKTSLAALMVLALLPVLALADESVAQDLGTGEQQQGEPSGQDQGAQQGAEDDAEQGAVDDGADLGATPDEVSDPTTLDDNDAAALADDELSDQLDLSPSAAQDTLTTLSGDIDITSYLGNPASDMRRLLDLKDLKAAGHTDGTLIIEGSQTNKMFVSITDTSTAGDPTGIYDIKIGEWGGVEILSTAGALNTFTSIENKSGITNILPVYVNVNVRSIKIIGDGSLKLNPSVSFPTFYAYSSTYVDRKLGIVVNGAGVVVDSLSVSGINVQNYNQEYAGGYVYPVFIGANNAGTIKNLTIGNFSMTLSNAQIGSILGAAGNAQIDSYTITGEVTITGTNATYGASCVIGGSSSTITSFIVRSSAAITFSGVQVKEGGTFLGASGGSSQNLTIETGSTVKMRAGNVYVQSATIIGGDFLDTIAVYGDIDITTNNAYEPAVLIGRYSPRDPSKRILIGNTANIKAAGEKYQSVAIGVHGTGVTNPSERVAELIVEDGASIDLTLTNRQFSQTYFTTDNALGNTQYGRNAASIKIGAVKQSDGSYAVEPGRSNTTIKLKGYRSIVYAASAQISANVYAETDAVNSDFYGMSYQAGSQSAPKIYIYGGNYLLQKPGADLTHIPFSVNLTAIDNTYTVYNRAKGYNQFNEPLLEKLYVDDAAGSSFVYNVPAANFGTLPEYDFTMVKSFVSGVDAKYKALYYPQRLLYAKLDTPVAGGSIAKDGVLKVVFDLPITVAENVDKGYTFYITNDSKSFPVPLVSSSDQYRIEDGALYIYLDKLTASSNGQALKAGAAYLSLSNGNAQKTLYEDDPQLTLTRRLNGLSGTITLTEPRYYMVSFDINGATSPASINSQSVRENTTATRPQPDPEKLLGYVFDGWFVEDAQGGAPYLWDFTTDTVTGDMTLVAEWSLAEYTVDFLPGTPAGVPLGAQAPFAPASYTASYGSSTAGLIDFTIADPLGWRFTGWSPALAPTVTKDATYTAQWERVMHTVTFLPGAHGLFAPVSQSVQFGTQTATLINFAVANPLGWRFTGWSPALAPTVIEDAVYIAQWEAVTYRITYYSTGHTSGTVPASTLHQEGSNAPVASQGSLARQGYTFSGWDTSIAAATVVYGANAQVASISGDINLSAVWTQTPEPPTPTTYQVSYAPGGDGVSGLPAAAANLNAGDLYTISSAVPTRSGYTFDGWSSSVAGTYAAGDSFTMPADNVVLTARWNIDEPDTPTPLPGPSVTDPVTPPTPDDTRLPSVPGLNEEEQAQIEAQTGNPLTDILGGNVPLGNFDVQGAWSLLSLLIAALTAFTALVLAALQAVRKSRERRHLALRLLGIAAGVVAPVVFFALNNISLPLVWINSSTLIVGIIGVVQLALVLTYVLLRRMPKSCDNCDSAEPDLALGAEAAEAAEAA